MTDPPPIEHRRLVDDVGALLHQVVGRRGAVFVRVIPVVVAADDLAPARTPEDRCSAPSWGGRGAGGGRPRDPRAGSACGSAPRPPVARDWSGDRTQKPNQVRRRKDQFAVWSPSPMHATDSNGTAIGGDRSTAANYHPERRSVVRILTVNLENKPGTLAKVAESLGNAASTSRWRQLRHGRTGRSRPCRRRRARCCPDRLPGRQARDVEVLSIVDSRRLGRRLRRGRGRWG